MPQATWQQTLGLGRGGPNLGLGALDPSTTIQAAPDVLDLPSRQQITEYLAGNVPGGLGLGGIIKPIGKAGNRIVNLTSDAAKRLVDSLGIDIMQLLKESPITTSFRKATQGQLPSDWLAANVENNVLMAPSTLKGLAPDALVGSLKQYGRSVGGTGLHEGLHSLITESLAKYPPKDATNVVRFRDAINDRLPHGFKMDLNYPGYRDIPAGQQVGEAVARLYEYISELKARNLPTNEFEPLAREIKGFISGSESLDTVTARLLITPQR